MITKETAVVESTAIPVVFDITEARIEQMRAECTGLIATDNKSYEHLRKALAVVRTARTEIEKRRKYLKEDALAYGRRVDAMAASLKAKIVAIEDPLKAEADRYDAEQERIRYEKANAERLAREAEERAKREAEEARLKALREAEEARLAEARKKFEAERAEAEKKQREEAAKLEAERAAMRAERAKIDAEQLAERNRLKAIQDEIDAKNVREPLQLIQKPPVLPPLPPVAPKPMPARNTNKVPHALILQLIAASDALDVWIDGCKLDGEHPAMETAGELNNSILALITDDDVGDSHFAANHCDWNCFAGLR